MSEELEEMDIHGDAAAYVLGALTEEEHAGYVEHLVTCVRCREEVASLQIVAASLPAAVPQLEAPQDLKRRVMDTVGREASEQDAARARAGAGVERSRRTRPASGERPGWLAPLGGLAAVAAVVALAIVAFTGSSSSPTRVYRAQVTLPAASASVSVSGGHAALTVANMPQSPRGKVYELWIKRAGAPEPTDALFMVSRAGTATVGVPGNIRGVTEILVTAEPEGGSKVPTSTPVIVAPLSS